MEEKQPNHSGTEILTLIREMLNGGIDYLNSILKPFADFFGQ